MGERSGGLAGAGSAGLSEAGAGDTIGREWQRAKGLGDAAGLTAAAGRGLLDRRLGGPFGVNLSR
ncbi:MAG: hypothetical protein ACKO45_09555 [Cyanobium sp.]